MPFRRAELALANALLVAACSDDSATPIVSAGAQSSGEHASGSDDPTTFGLADSSSSTGVVASSETTLASGDETGDLAMIPCGGGSVPAVALASPLQIEEDVSFESDFEVWDRTLLFLDFTEHSLTLWTSNEAPITASLESPFDTGRIGAGDFDGDSDVDLLVVSEGPGDGRPVIVFEQDEVGAWQEFAQVDVGPAGATNATFVDLLPSSDGAELVVALRDRARIFSLDAVTDTEFAFSFDFLVEEIYPSGDILAADVNDDDFLDLIIHGRGVGLGNGRQLVAAADLASSGGYARGYQPAGSGPLAMALLSVSDTLDGRPIRFLEGFGDGTFEPWASAEVVGSSCYSEPDVGDFNGDGLDDLVFPTVCESTETHDARLDFWLGCPDGTRALFSETYPDGVQRLQAADFNDDGRTDLALLGPASFSDPSEPATSASLAVLLATSG